MTWDEHYATAAGFRRWPNEELVRASSRRRFDRVLEVGCGNGANLPYLLTRANEVVGIDTADAALSVATQDYGAFGPALKLANYDAFEMPYPAGYFDGVVDVMTSQHVPERRHSELYSHYRRVLKTNGWLFLYHLVALSGTKTLVSAAAGQDYTDVAQFPTVDLVCLPSIHALGVYLGDAGFVVKRAGSIERKTDIVSGAEQRYAVIEAEAQ